MKSLLVDALRKANGTVAADSREEPVEQPDSVGVAADAGEPAGIVADGKLLPAVEIEDTPLQHADPPGHDSEPAAEVPEQIAVSEPAQPAADQTASPPASAANERLSGQERPVVDPALELPALDLAEIELEAEHPDQSAVDSEPVAERPAPGLVPVAKGDGFSTLARWSPALCAVVLTAAAGSLVIYQNITAQEPGPSIKADLLSTPSSIDDVAVTPVWQVLAETNADERRGQVRTDSGPVQSTAAALPAVNQPLPNAQAERPASIAANRADPHFDEVRTAYSLFLSGDDNAAAAAYQAVLDKDPLHRQALSGLAAVLQRSSRDTEAVAVYERLLSIDPGNSTAAAALAAHAPDAETRIKSRLQREPANAAFHFALGLVMSRQARWAEAFESFSTARRLRPGNADYAYNAAVSAQHLGRNSRAREFYSDALAALDDRSMIDRHTVESQLNRLGQEQREAGL